MTKVTLGCLVPSPAATCLVECSVEIDVGDLRAWSALARCVELRAGSGLARCDEEDGEEHDDLSPPDCKDPP